MILITVDSLRYDAIGCSGNEAVITPNVDALARESVVFEQAIANGPRTQSSFPSILCSLYPLVAGERDGLPEAASSLPEALSEAGYVTAGFNPSNPFLTRETGYDRGWDLFVDFWDANPRHETSETGRSRRAFRRRLRDAVGRRNLGFLMLLQALLQQEGGQYLTGDVLVERGMEWMQRQDRPFFAWLHFMDAHFPYHPLPGQRRWVDRGRYLLGMAGIACGSPRRADQELRKLYERRVELIDGFVGRLRRFLRRSGLGDRTVLVFTSDHGEQFGEHGGYAHGPNVYDELVRVPLLVHAPGRLGGRRVSRQFALIDLAPTLLDVIDVRIPGSFEGRSQTSLLRGEEEGSEEHAFVEAMHSGGRRSRIGSPDVHRIVACRTSRWKYVRDEEEMREELYDLQHDAGETKNVASRRSDVREELRHRVDEHLAFVVEEAHRMGNRRSGHMSSGDEELRRRLARLGYL